MEFEKKPKKNRKKFKWFARCPGCCEKVALTEQEDPDRTLGRHRATDCWWYENERKMKVAS